MDLAQFKTQYPDISQALIDEGIAQGAATERARIMAVEAQALPGHEALITEMKNDGKTTGPEAAARVLAAEKVARKGRLDLITAEAPKPVPPSLPVEEAAAGPGPNAPIEEQAKHEWDHKHELREEFTSFGAYLGWRKAEARGAAKILKKSA